MNCFSIDGPMMVVGRFEGEGTIESRVGAVGEDGEDGRKVGHERVFIVSHLMLVYVTLMVFSKFISIYNYHIIWN